MNRSENRILTTHVGSLPRPADLFEVLQSKQPGQEKSRATLLRDSVAEIVRKQVAIGLDVVNDGEFGKLSFLTYANERLGGFESGKPRGSPWAGSREVAAFPDFYSQAARRSTNPSGTHAQMLCTGPITYKGQELVQRDIANLKAALHGVKVADVFLPAISPSSVEDWNKNAYYKTQEDFVFAIAEALREEYKAIVDAGFLLQVDDPHLVTYYVVHPDASIEECRKWAEFRVEALNHALKGIPEDRVRHHTCYGINMGPRVHDMEMKHILDILLKINAGAYSFEAANPRHEHEWHLWETTKLPKGKLLIPGMISQSTVLVEHPELVADRIMRYAKVVGRENIIAGADCGFASFAGTTEVLPSIVWAKFQSLVEGARIASKQLWPN